MRIISGQLKGKKILEPKDKNTRPLKDLAKESLFNIINHSNKLSMNIENSNILDLFAGVGSFGLEALSRGANQITFVENYPNVIEVLKKNIKNLALINKCKIIEKDIFKDIFFEKLDQKYNIIFLDPPFNETKVYELISRIFLANILKKNGIIILHRNNKYKENFPNEFKVVYEKNYGLSKIVFGNFS